MVLLAAPALAAGDKIEVGDVAGSDGNWQQGRAVIDAPLDEVRGWLVDFEHWPTHFPDVTSAKVLAHGRDTAKLRFASRVIGRELTIDLHWTAREISYRGAGKNVDVQGKITLAPEGDRRTSVVMQSTANVHGLAGAFATKGLKRDRAFKKLRADLGALEHLSQTM
ncbi:MAG TPA: SRPBCC family protein [Polyangia bacterium]